MSHFRSRFRRWGRTLLWLTLLLIAVVIANLLGIYLAGNISNWDNWMQAHSAWFMGWRVLLYTATVWGWLWMRRHLRIREPEAAPHRRLLRVEIAAVLAFIALETSLLLEAL